MDDIMILLLAKKYADQVGQQIISAGFKVQVEQDRSILNGQGQEKILYLLPKASGSTGDGYDEFVYAQNNWEWIGKTDIDLSGYALKTEVGDLDNLPTTDKSSLVAAVSETFTNVSDGKALVASAITDKGVQTSSDATFATMAQNIEDIPTGSPTGANPALVLWDWEDTKLAEYSREDALALIELPAPNTLPAYADVDHDLLVFQKWNCSLANIKTWIQNHEGETRDVGAIYTTTDGQDHNYWGNPRLDTASTINMQKRATASIRTNAFNSCYSLTSINIPDGVTSIGTYAFNSCYSLTSINIPDGVTSIGTYAFQSCQSLTSINIPDGVTSIGTSAFYGCYSLTQINIPDGVTSIEDGAFYGCYSLTSINIPDGVTSIGTSAFYGCYSLTSINIPDGVTSIGTYAFQNCYSLTSINIPDGVTSIGTSAFQSCQSLTSINIPDGVTSIRNGAFNSCHSLTSINIPDGVTSIGTYAFQSCQSLTSINIPDGVTSIGTYAFQSCQSLCDVLLESKPTLANTNALSGLPTNYRIYVPRSDLSWFKTATNWSTIYTQGHIVAIEDYINYLESIGFNVEKYKEAV